MIYNFLRFPGGREKAVTLSYDDGTVDDIRLTETINRYGLKCTFNLIGSRLAQNKGLSVDFVRNEILGKGHEVANHGYEHRAQGLVRRVEAIRDVLRSREYLEETFGIIVRGMAFPDRSVNRFSTPDVFEDVRQSLMDLDIAYARNAGGDNDQFCLPESWHHWNPTAHHKNPQLMEYIDKFLNLELSKLYRSSREPRLFFLWGHAFEFERDNNWELLETICQKLAGHEEIWYATSMEICDYVNAYRALIYSADGRIIYNSTLFEIWFDIDGTLYSIKPGQTLKI